MSNFTYPGNVLNNKLNWEHLIVARIQHASRIIEGLFRFACKLGHKPVAKMLTLYKSKCMSVATFGAGVWGYHKSSQIQILENTFLKRLLMIPSRSSTSFCHSEVGLHYGKDRINIAPLILWGKIWTSEDLLVSRSILIDCMNLDIQCHSPGFVMLKILFTK